MIYDLRDRKPPAARPSRTELRSRREKLQATRVECVPHDSFATLDPLALLAETEASFQRLHTSSTQRSTADELRLLTSGEESELFRRLNLFRFHAQQAIATLTPQSTQRQLKQIERLLSAAEAIRNHLVQVNVRLVSFVARNFVDRHFMLGELLSEGYWTLLRSIDRFDFSKGFRFSTYATWALRFNFNRAVAEGRRKRNRALHLDDCEESSVNDLDTTAISERRYPELQQQIGELLENLDPREQAIVRARFGMTQQHDGETLKSIAQRMGVCKERVRQLELRAMNKLRQAAIAAGLSAEQFDS